MTKQSNLKKLNFWQLCWKRYSEDHDSFFEMFKTMALELNERKHVNRVAVRTIVQTVAILTAIGIIAFILHLIYPHDTTIDKIFIWGPIIALGIISIVLYLGYHISKGFAYYVEHHNKFTIGGGYYDGIDISSMLDEINPTKRFWRWIKKIFS